MQIVIPMAGLGQRFRDAGYTIPKPLIPIGGVPMVVRVVRALPRAERVVFVCHPEHVACYPIEEMLRQHVPGARVVVAPSLTAGQACSVALAAGELVDDQVLVAACDNTQGYDAGRFAALTSDPSVDAVVWTYRGEPRVLVRPQSYGWVKEEGGLVRSVSVKKPLSEHLLDDHVVCGTFWFRSARLMLDAIDDLVRSGQRVNNEYYLDSVPNHLLSAGRNVAVFELEKYIGWGTPEDLEDYLRWERHFGTREAA